VLNLRKENGQLIGDVQVQRTPAGRALQEMLDAGIRTDFRTAGVCNFAPGGDGVLRVENYQLISVNAVNNGA
jgi:hypothetical protein